jgi:RNA polymerase sigma-70 factor (ECF subfamily)
MSTDSVTAAVANLLTIAEPRDASPTEGRDTPQVRALVEAAQAGDSAAFGELVTLHQRAVFRAALAALGAREDAEDAAQEAFVVAWQKLPGFRGDSMFRTWLLTIVWRKALDKRRQRRLWWHRTRSAHGPGDDACDPIDALAGDGPDPERAALSREMATRVRDEIVRLSPRLKDTLLLASSGEHTYGEIAAILGVPLGTVKWRVAEARRLVLERIDD